MTKEEAAVVLDLMVCDISAAEKEEGYTYDRWELREALELAVEELRKKNMLSADEIIGKSTFSQRYNLQKEYEEWIEQRNKEIQEFSNDEVDPNSLITAIVFLESKGFRRVFYD